MSIMTEELFDNAVLIEVASGTTQPVLGQRLYMTQGILEWVTDADASEEPKRFNFIRERIGIMAALSPDDDTIVFGGFNYQSTEVCIITDAADSFGIRPATVIHFPHEFIPR